MPSFCEYRNCHNLASSTWGGYCNEYHFLRAQLLEAKEKVKEVEEKLKKQQELSQVKVEDKKK